ncbi:sugar phosphate isomerase/epimerase family protein [Bacteroidota bacterium]
MDFGKAHGVVIGIQNHDDFIKTADQAIEIIERINSDWCQLILDTGSYRTGDPYKEIAKSIPYTVNWQVKVNLYVNGVEEKADFPRLIRIIKESGYRGYIPLETLGEGDPTEKVDRFFKEIRKLL